MNFPCISCPGNEFLQEIQVGDVPPAGQLVAARVQRIQDREHFNALQRSDSLPAAVDGADVQGFFLAQVPVPVLVESLDDLPEGFVREGKFHDPEGCAAIVRDLLAGAEKPTCILCPDDYSCLGALWDLKASGVKIPEEVSLVGYDGIRMTRMIQPMLTTYRQNTEVIAQKAIGLLIEAIETPEEHKPRQITVEGMLLEGDTLSELSR